MSGICNTDINLQFERAKKKYNKMTLLNQIIDDDTQMSKDQKINALVLIAKELIDQQSKYEKTIALKEQKEKNIQEELEYKNQVVQKYQSGLLKAKNQYYQLEKLHKQLIAKVKQQDAKINCHGEATEYDKYASERKILSMQNQVNFLLKKENQQEMVKQTAKIQKETQNYLNNQENMAKEKRPTGKSQTKHFSKRRQSVK